MDIGKDKNILISAAQTVCAIFVIVAAVKIVSAQPKEGFTPRPLDVGQSIKRDIGEEGLHFYRIELKRGQVLQVEVLPAGIDINVKLFIAENSRLNFLKEVDTGAINQLDTLLWETDRNGVYMLAVEISGMPSSGEYQLKAKVEDSLTDVDKQWLEAEALYVEARTIYKRNSVESGKLAVEKLQQAFLLFEAKKDKYYQGIILRRIALVNLALGEKEEALKYFNKAVLFFTDARDIAGEAVTLNNIGFTYNSLEEKDTALSYYNKALLLFKQTGDKGGEAMALNNIGYVYNLSGKKSEALKFYNQSLPLRKAVGDIEGEAVTLNNIGFIYDSIGERREALKYYFNALRLNRDAADKDGEATTLTNIGLALSYFDRVEAVKYYLQALPLFREIRNRLGEASILTNMGVVFFRLGKKQEALKYYDQALTIARADGDRNAEAATLNNIGAIYFSLENKPEALKNYTQALSILKIIGNGREEAAVLRNMMELWQPQNPRVAIFYGKESINKLQELRKSIRGLGTETEKIFLGSIIENYKTLTEILIAEGRYSEAVQTLNLFQDQQFYDFNQNSSERVKQLDKTPREIDLASRYEQSSSKIGEINAQLKEFKRKFGAEPTSAAEKRELSRLETQLKTAAGDFLSVLDQIEKEFAKPSDDKDKAPLGQDLIEMQAALRETGKAVNQKNAAIYTLIGENNFHVLLITPDNVKDFSTPVKGTDLNERILKLHAVMQSPAYDPRPLGKELYNIILKPAESELNKQNIQTLLWQLDGNLRYIPMAALYDGEKYLVEKYRNVVFTRADRERMVRPVSARWTGTVFGSSLAQTVDLPGDVEKISFSALPGVTQEIRSIFRLDAQSKAVISGEVLTDKQFTKEKFYDVLKKRRPLVHISSHFAFRPGDDSRSFLLLGDGFLTLNEIKKQTDLFQGVELLTLSACNTAAAQSDATGREIDGFAELAQRLGAGAVLATLWQVSDASTPALMRDFYTTRESKTGVLKAEALRAAQLGLLNGTAKIEQLPDVKKGISNVEIVILPKGTTRSRDNQSTRSDVIYLDEAEAPPFQTDKKKPFAHPYYWSPFVLYGNWR